MLKPGDKAPDFSLPADDGSTIRLSDLRGRKVVLYFYPKDDTPGCTTEACEFRDKYELPFRLLADEKHEVAERFGVWKQKKFMGRKYMGVERTTFVIDEDGQIAEVYEKVKAKGHAGDVLARL